MQDVVLNKMANTALIQKYIIVADLLEQCKTLNINKKRNCISALAQF